MTHAYWAQFDQSEIDAMHGYDRHAYDEDELDPSDYMDSEEHDEDEGVEISMESLGMSWRDFM